MYLSWQTIITSATIIASVAAIIGYFAKGVRWVDKINKNENEIAAMKEEQTLLVYGVLACLKGLQESGCNSSVHDAIDKIEKFLNKRAHV